VLLEGRDVPIYVAGSDLGRIAFIHSLYDQATGLQNELLPRLLLHLVPGLVGAGGEGGILPLVLCQPDDA